MCVLGVLGVLGVLVGCSGAATPARTGALDPHTRTADPTAPTTSAVSPPTTWATPAPTRTSTAPPPPGPGGILGRYRVVAYYGGPSGPGLGVLGTGPPDEMAKQIEQRAKAFARFGRPVLPAMELIATVAQAAPGKDGSYSKPIPTAVIARYLAAAHRHHMLLILDFQPGRAEFLPQVRAVAQYLVDPSVSVALDPEWKMGPGKVPGKVIGSASAASVNAVSRYLAGIVVRNHLPDKLLLVHQFRLPMLPDRDRIAPSGGIEIVFHADGFGTQRAKLATWHKLAFPGRPFGTGFKLFLRQDVRMMTAAQAMAVRPTPDVITYQ
ncbi:MAG: hypothetical protein QOH14_1385 [Pseudonocardiales bacterium]|nr:hypothetical protein [Pseudonocardiales bacterium]